MGILLQSLSNYTLVSRAMVDIISAKLLPDRKHATNRDAYLPAQEAGSGSPRCTIFAT